MQIDPLSANDFGARISGIVLSQLDQQDFKAIYEAFLKVWLYRVSRSGAHRGRTNYLWRALWCP